MYDHDCMASWCDGKIDIKRKGGADDEYGSIPIGIWILKGFLTLYIVSESKDVIDN